MSCPVCKPTEFVLPELQGIEIDRCSACRSIWLDRGELDSKLDKGRQVEEAFRTPALVEYVVRIRTL